MCSKLLRYFSPLELALWLGSTTLICVAFLAFDRESVLPLLASLIGVTSLIFCAKGNPFGQLLMVIFSLLYGWISLSVAYYGEMITYVGMTMPMAALSMISWLRHPYQGSHAQVTVHRITLRECQIIALLALVVTVVFYFILAHFNTANLLPSTFSVTTSFVAVCLTFRRSPYFALGYAVNDAVLILLWTLASVNDVSCLSMVVCFSAFLVNDLYGFFSWRKMECRQRAIPQES